MNCPEFQEWLQRRLDGIVPPLTERGEEDSPGLAEHVAVCAECREQHDASRRLVDGLRARQYPAVPENLGTRIVAGVLRDMHRRQVVRRRLWIGMSLAASIAVMVLGGYLLFGPKGDEIAPIAKDDKERKE